jgi:hypothetical protein
VPQQEREDLPCVVVAVEYLALGEGLGVTIGQEHRRPHRRDRVAERANRFCAKLGARPARDRTSRAVAKRQYERVYMQRRDPKDDALSEIRPRTFRICCWSNPAELVNSCDRAAFGLNSAAR